MKGSGLRGKNILVSVFLGSLALALGSILSIGGLGLMPSRELRGIGLTIAYNSYNPWNKTLTSYSLNAVSAVIWDFRGIDTVLETAVLFAAVTGVSMVFRNVERKTKLMSDGMTLVLKTSTKLIILLIMLVSLSLAIHGHLTPGGGFQAGSVLTVSVALSITIYSIEILHKAGLATKNLLSIRFTALTFILLVALLPLMSLVLTGSKAYIMQNQVKEDSAFSMPAMFIHTPLAGSIFLFNILEFVAVSAALSYVLIILAKHEKKLKNDQEKVNVN